MFSHFKLPYYLVGLDIKILSLRVKSKKKTDPEDIPEQLGMVQEPFLNILF